MWTRIIIDILNCANKYRVACRINIALASHEAYIDFRKSRLLLHGRLNEHGTAILIDDVHILIVMLNLMGRVNISLILTRWRIIILHRLLS